MSKNKYKLLIPSIVLILVPFVVNASDNKYEPKKTVWSCKIPYTKDNVLWLVEWGRKSYVKVFDDRIPAKYSLDGLEKRWDWGLDSDNSYNYAVTLKPDLKASYYDFSSAKNNTANSKQVYKCSK